MWPGARGIGQDSQGLAGMASPGEACPLGGDNQGGQCFNLLRYVPWGCHTGGTVPLAQRPSCVTAMSACFFSLYFCLVPGQGSCGSCGTAGTSDQGTSCHRALVPPYLRTLVPSYPRTLVLSYQTVYWKGTWIRPSTLHAAFSSLPFSRQDGQPWIAEGTRYIGMGFPPPSPFATSLRSPSDQQNIF